ncbi:MAG TPA: acetate/propionate family kinase, partial [Pirellulales bacterium]|nr:acetate/propionate family kinase [Pirellulales bacterium]
RIGTSEASLEIAASERQAAERRDVAAADHAQAVLRLNEWFDGQGVLKTVSAVGHRIVHGGQHYSQPEQITPPMVAELKRLVPIDPTHLPGEIALIEAFERHLPDVPQVACFDTAFHRELPRVAWLLPIPRRYADQGVRRYGFHGLSFTYLLAELGRLDPAAAAGRVVLAHLGAGASMAAVRGGQPIDTTMSFTPAAGLVMGTRAGDIDAGVLTYLMRSEGLDADQLDRLVNYQSGLLGLSETSSDMRDLLQRRPSDRRAADAVAAFCYQARKWVGALAAALGGLDALVFSGGIGENAPPVRAEICQGLEHLGIRLDAGRNDRAEPVISAGSACRVRLIRTNEEAVIVDQVRRVIANQPTAKAHT